jgi:hypothetical protein
MRLWLKTLKSKLDFLLCSTPEMRDLGVSLVPKIPAHVMNDPAPPLATVSLQDTLNRKLETAHNTRVLRILWFGIGDNPHFAVGLSDLVAWAPELARLRDKGFQIQLDILTNKRALTNDTLVMLRHLPIEAGVEEWNEARETELLSESFACFLPVNAQNFSIVKSLNRAVTALCAGTQVLSVGYPLYSPLKELVYREPLKLLADLEVGQPLLRGETIGQLSELLRQWADPELESHAFAAFLGNLTQRPPFPRSPYTAVIHGLSSPPHAHKFAQRAHALSVASPFYRGKLNFDVKFEFAEEGEGLRVLVSEKQLGLLEVETRKLMSHHGRVVDTIMHTLDIRALGLAPLTNIPSELIRAPMVSTLLYAEVMGEVRKTLDHLFPSVRCYISEIDALSMDSEEALCQEIA